MANMLSKICFVFLVLLISTHDRIMGQQNFSCGTPDIPLSIRQEIFAQLPPTTASTTNTSPWRVSVWFYDLRKSDGTANQNFNSDEFIASANQYFSGLFEFVKCGYTIIPEDAFFSLNVSTSYSSLNTYIQGLNNPLPSKCIKVFLVSSGILYVPGFGNPQGYTFSPLNDPTNNAIFIAGNNNYAFSHEVGHYFGLPHTFSNTANGAFDYVNSPVVINGITYTCYQTGDGFCDTPADPNGNISYCNADIACSVTCDIVDPLGVPYSPDVTLLMSYYNNCANRFSDEQKQAMRTLYLFHSGYAHLRDPMNPCTEVKTGRVEKFCAAVGPILGTVIPVANNNVEVSNNVTTCGQNTTNSEGRYLIAPCNLLPTTQRYIQPDKNYLSALANGVSTFDILLIQKHILGIEYLVSPYQLLAADANYDSHVTTSDILLIRKIVLGIISDPAMVPAGSWRYVPEFLSFDIPNTPSFSTQFNDGNPFDAIWVNPFNQSPTYYEPGGTNNPIPSWMDKLYQVTTSTSAQTEAAWSFAAIKTGDINCNAIADGMFNVPSPDKKFVIDATGSSPILTSGAIKKVQIIANGHGNVAAWQIGTVFPSSKFTVLNVDNGTIGTDFDPDNFYYPLSSLNGSSKLNAIWFPKTGVALDLDQKVLFEAEIEVNQTTDLENSFLMSSTQGMPTVFYGENGEELKNIALSIKISDAVIPRGNNQKALVSASNVKAFWGAEASKLRLDIDSPVQCVTDFSLFSVTGIKVCSQQLSLEKGYNHLELLNFEDQPSGAYFYFVEINGQRFSKIIIKP